MLIKVPKYANLEVDYISIDSDETFKANLRTKPPEWRWRTDRISYKTNSHGYRTREFDQVDWQNYFISFGDSNTFGTGTVNEELYTSIISNRSGIQAINAGMIGCSPTFIMHNFFNFMSKIEILPKFVLILWPIICRQTWFLPDEVYHWLPQLSHTEKRYRPLDDLSVKLSEYDYHMLTTWKHNRTAIQMTCKAHGVKLLESTFIKEYVQLSPDIVQAGNLVPPSHDIIDMTNNYKARDYSDTNGGHYGSIYHTALANHFGNLL